MLGACSQIHLYADFRCCLAAGFFAAVSFACFLPKIGMSISFWPLDALRGFLAAFFGALVSAGAPPTLRRRASIRSTTFSPRGRSFGVIGLPVRFWYGSNGRAASPARALDGRFKRNLESSNFSTNVQPVRTSSVRISCSRTGSRNLFVEARRNLNSHPSSRSFLV